MFKFFSRFTSEGRSKHSLLNHNQIDASAMARFLGMKPAADQAFVIRDFKLEEDLSKALTAGVHWRRRRFMFQVPAGEGTSEGRPEALCINEITLDSNARAEVAPCLAADFPHLSDMAAVENAYWATTFASGAIRRSDGKKERRVYLNMGDLLYGDSSGQAVKLIERIRKVAESGEWTPEDEEALEALDPYVSEGEGGRLGVARYLPAFPASRLVQSSKEILAATNAGYFLNFPEEYDDGVSALHQPVGGHMIDGRLVAPPWIARPGIMGFESGKTLAAMFGPWDLELLIEGHAPIRLHPGLDSTASPDGAVWRSFDEARTPPPEGAAQIAFCGAVPVAVAGSAEGILKAPFGGAVVYVTAKAAATVLAEGGIGCMALRLHPFKQGIPKWLISSGPFLVRDSAVVSTEEMLTTQHAGEFGPGGPAPTRFPFNTSQTMAPRTAFGVTPTGGFKMVVVDGPRSGEHSCGLSLEGLSHLMQWVGCETAINFDGGGSSVLAIEGADHADMLMEDSPYGVMNIPSDDGGSERIVPVFLMVKEK